MNSATRSTTPRRSGARVTVCALTLITIMITSACGGPSSSVVPVPSSRANWFTAPLTSASVEYRAFVGVVTQAETFAVGRCEDILLFSLQGPTEIRLTDARSLVLPEDNAVRLTAVRAFQVLPQGEVLVAVIREMGQGAPRPAYDALGACASGDEPGAAPQTVAASSARHFAIAGGTMGARILLDASVGAARGGLTLLSASPGATVPVHTHEGSAEILFIRHGGGTMQLGEQEFTLRAGEVVYVPEGTPHDYRNTGQVPMEAIQIYAPSGPEQRFRAR